MVHSCASTTPKEASPEDRLLEAQDLMGRRHFESAIDILQDLRLVTAGTGLADEVQFLLAESRFRSGMFAEAANDYESYIRSHPEGYHVPRALYRRGISLLKQLEKKTLGFFSIRSTIPHDRDISPLVEARKIFSEYLDRYPDGEDAGDASRWVETLLVKEGRHELGVASFYLRKGNHSAAMSRIERVLAGTYPREIMDDATSLAAKAGDEAGR